MLQSGIRKVKIERNLGRPDSARIGKGVPVGISRPRRPMLTAGTAILRLPCAAIVTQMKQHQNNGMLSFAIAIVRRGLFSQ